MSKTVLELLNVESTPDITINQVNSFFINVGKKLSPQVAGLSYRDKSLSTNDFDLCNSIVLVDTDEAEVILCVLIA